MHPVDDLHSTQYLLKRYWEAALGFWRKDARHTAWLLTIAVFSIALLNLGLGLLLNIWNRVMFDGLDNRDMRIVLFQSIIFLPLVLGSLAMAIADTYSKMSLQRRWRSLAQRTRVGSLAHQRPLLSTDPASGRAQHPGIPRGRGPAAECRRSGGHRPGCLCGAHYSHHLYRRAVVHRWRDHHPDRNHDVPHPRVPGDHCFPLRGTGQRRHGENRPRLRTAG